MRDESSSEKKTAAEVKKLLNTKEPLDNLILELSEQGELKIDVVQIKEPPEPSSDGCSARSLRHRGKHTS